MIEILIKCSWCGKLIGEKPPYGGIHNEYSTQVTHGICEECQRGMDADIRAEQLEKDKVEL